jgi:hypothetical protein
MFSYNSSANPDSARIIISSSSTSAPVAGSILYVDDLSFVTLAPFTVAEDSANASCSGVCNGRASVTPAGGETPYTYLWSASAGSTTDSSKTGLCNGTYTVTVTDAGGQTKVASFNIINTSTLTPPTTSTTNNCGVANGTATVTPTSGTTPYNYLWSANASSQTTQTATGLTPATYNVTVTDNIGCTVSASATVGSTQLNAPTTTSTNENCGLDNGTATVTATAGVWPFSYQWSANASSQTTQTATGLASGTYNVTVTDDNGCTASTSTTVSVTGLPTPTTSSTNENCGQANGTATVTATSGVSPFDYLWSAGAANQTTQTATGLTAGNYGVTITDDNGCTASAIATVGSSGGLSATTTTTPVSCFNGSNGTAKVTITGGTGPYTIEWDSSAGGQTIDTVSGLRAGTYNVTILDAGGCTYIATATITQPSPISVSLVDEDILCNGGTSSISFTVSGGTAPYSYIWNNGASNDTLLNQPAGIYCVIVTDDNGCTVTECDTLTEPSAIIATIAHDTILCFGGRADLSVSATGGEAPYNYIWGAGETTDTLLNRDARTYCVTVVDDNGCSPATTCITLTQPAVLSVSIAHDSILCFDGTGYVALVGFGGTVPFTYEWSSGETTDTLLNRPAGVYSVTVTDKNGCTASDTATMSQPYNLSFSMSSTNVSTNGGNDGVAVAHVSGGSQPVTLEWSNSDTGDSITGLTAGTYVVTATDANGCTLIDSVTITQPVGIDNVSAGISFAVYPNPVKDELTVALNNTQQATVRIYNSLGALVHTEMGTGRMVIATNTLQAGVFILEVQVGGEKMTERLVKLD